MFTTITPFISTKTLELQDLLTTLQLYTIVLCIIGFCLDFHLKNLDYVEGEKEMPTLQNFDWLYRDVGGSPTAQGCKLYSCGMWPITIHRNLRKSAQRENNPHLQYICGASHQFPQILANSWSEHLQSYKSDIGCDGGCVWWQKPHKWGAEEGI